MGIHVKRLFVLGALAIVSVACGSTTPAMPNPVTEPVIDQPGRYIVRYRDTVIEIVLDTTAANWTIEWIADQPWCNGRIGTLGGSALDEHAQWILMHRDRSIDQGEIWRMSS